MKKSARPIFRYAIPIQCLVLLAYVWYLTAGLWTTLPGTFATGLYDELATAFQKGQLYLDRRPAPDLLALSDPYAVQQRKHVSSYIGDATLYDGRYYLYWGPVPAVLLSFVKSTFYTGRIGDDILTFGFICGLFVVLSTLLMALWRRHFPDVPRWAALGAIPLIGLITPSTWMINHPLIYEAALASAQFFFAGGLCCAYLALARPKSSPGLFALTGLCWALAVGSQFTQILTVIVVLGLTTISVYVNRRRVNGERSFLLTGAVQWAPVAIMLLALAWYNRERFGSVLEFGYRYQLAVVNLHEHYREIFSPAYSISNLYNYFLNPFRTSQTFPFIVPQYGTTLSGFPLSIPKIYYTEAITGLLYTAPFIVYALIPVIAAGNDLRRRGMGSWLSDFTGEPLDWLKWSLIGAVVVQLGVLLFFYYSAPRYLLALMPNLTLLAVIGFWQSEILLSKRVTLRVLNRVSGITLAAFSILVSSLLAISSSQDRFIDANPGLIQHINSLFFR